MDASNSTLATAEKAKSKPQTEAKTKVTKAIEVEQTRRGRKLCRNEDHYSFHKSKLADKPWRTILEMMETGSVASCYHEKDACRAAWERQDHLSVLESSWVSYGSYRKGLSKHFGDRRVLLSRHKMTRSQKDYVEAVIPSSVVVESHNATMHDHPVARLLQYVAERQLLDSLPSGTKDKPCVYLDLHGNASKAITWNKRFASTGKHVRIETLSQICTPKDFIRAAAYNARIATIDEDHKDYKYVSELKMKPIRDLTDDDVRHLSGTISVHTNYYYTEADFRRLVMLMPQSNHYMICHNFEGMTGTLCGGDLTFTKVPNPAHPGELIVHQRNAKGSDAYDHPDNASWFNTGASILGRGYGMAWTVNRWFEGVNLITMVGCPPSFINGGIEPVLEVNSTEWIAKHNYFLVKLDGREIHVACKSHEEIRLFQKLRGRSTLRERNLMLIKDLTSWAQNRCSGRSERECYDVPTERIADVVLAAAFADLQDHTVTVLMAKELGSDLNSMLAASNLPLPKWWERIVDRFRTLGDGLAPSNPYRKLGKTMLLDGATTAKTKPPAQAASGDALAIGLETAVDTVAGVITALPLVVKESTDAVQLARASLSAPHWTRSGPGRFRR